MPRVLLAVLFLSAGLLGQKKAAPPPLRLPCVVVSSSAPVSGVKKFIPLTSKHTYTYIYGDYPPGYPFRNTLKDKDVKKIEGKGGRVVILEPYYTPEDLQKAKKSCNATANPKPHKK